MRKHFLILMLLTLLPFSAWAVDTNPAAKAGLQYDGTAQELVTAGTISEKAIWYAAVLDGASAPVKEAYVKATVPSATNAGSYKVYWVAVASATTALADADIEEPNVIDAAIAKKPLSVVAKSFGITYGDATPAVRSFYTATGFIGEEGNTLVPVQVSTIDYTSAGERVFTLTALSLQNYAVSVPTATKSGTLNISKAVLTVTATDQADFVYGAVATNAITKEVSYSGFVNDETVDDIDVTGLTYTVEDAGHVTFAGNVGTYNIIPSGLAATNYDFNYVASDFTVTAKELDATMIANIDDHTYSATAFNPTPAVTFADHADGSKTLVKWVSDEDTPNWDYKLSYLDSNSDAIVAANIKNAGTYYVQIEANPAAGANYKDPATKVKKAFAIAKAQLNIKTKDQTKTYDAKVFDFAIDGTSDTDYARLLTITGLKGNDKYTDIFQAGKSLVVSALDGTNAAFKAGSYEITVAGSDDNDDNMFINYTPRYGNLGTLTINQKTIYVQAKPKNKKFGESGATKDPLKEGKTAVAADIIIGTSDELNDEGLITADADAFETNAATPAVKDGITTYPFIQRAGGENVGTEAITTDVTNMVVKNGEVDVTASYDIQTVNGTFTINAKGFAIWADNKTSVFGKALVPVTAQIEGMTASDKEVVQAEVNECLVRGEWTNVGTYPITLNKAALFAKFNGTNKDIWKNYVEPGMTADDIDYVQDNYTITPAPVKVVALPQVRMVGETVINEKNTQTIGFEAVEDNVLPSGADITEIYGALTLAYNIDGSYLETGALKAEALEHGKAKADDTHAADWDSEDGVYYNGIKLTVAGAYTTATDKNFTLTVVPGQLTVTTADVVELNANAANTANLTANAGKKLNIRIKNKNLTAGYWYTISLPFDITPFDFCNAVGSYAIFDRLQKTGDKLNFKISMEAIPAYTPFLVKVEKTVKFKDVVFNKVNIVDPAIIETEKNDTWKIVNTIDKGEVEGLVYWLKQENDGISLDMNETKGSFLGFDAYITTISGEPAAEARIFIEEADGSTTAISAITADGQLVPAEGWYTLNGVKLQGMPTQKGVYINNGKKIVIK